MGGSWVDVHEPVLEDEVIDYLQLKRAGVYVDGTLGLGGHTERILKTVSPAGRVIGFEWDDEAAGIACERLKEYGDSFMMICSSYANLVEKLGMKGVMQIDGLLLDLGVSSLQLDRGERGFSFQVDAPLDMRMDKRLTKTAADLIKRLSKEELADIFYNYGEERQARRIAGHIAETRENKPVVTTGQLAGIVAAAVPRRFHPKHKHVATRVFQALRIAVNREFDNLVKVLADAPSVLVSGARMCVITFHSIEDRIVKQAFLANSDMKVISKRPVAPKDEEILRNPRARSAKLRVAEKV